MHACIVLVTRATVSAAVTATTPGNTAAARTFAVNVSATLKQWYGLRRISGCVSHAVLCHALTNASAQAPLPTGVYRILYRHRHRQDQVQNTGVAARTRLFLPIPFVDHRGDCHRVDAYFEQIANEHSTDTVQVAEHHTGAGAKSHGEIPSGAPVRLSAGLR